MLGAQAPDWQEVHRVLRPGGRMLAADFVGTPVEQEGALLAAPGGAEAVAGCQRDLGRAGLVEARAFDVTGATWLPFFRHSREFFATKLLFRQVDPEQHDRVLAALPGGGLAVAAYVLVHAAKPPEA